MENTKDPTLNLILGVTDLELSVDETLDDIEELRQKVARLERVVAMITNEVEVTPWNDYIESRAGAEAMSAILHNLRDGALPVAKPLPPKPMTAQRMEALERSVRSVWSKVTSGPTMKEQQNKGGSGWG